MKGCCPPTGMTGLYQAWKDLVRKTEEGIWINLAFNHESPEARVVSFLPNEGRVTVVAESPATTTYASLVLLPGTPCVPSEAGPIPSKSI